MSNQDGCIYGIRLISYFMMFGGYALAFFGESIGLGVILIIIGTALNLYSRFKENNGNNN